MDASLPGRRLILQSAPVYLLFTQASAIHPRSERHPTPIERSMSGPDYWKLEFQMCCRERLGCVLDVKIASMCCGTCRFELFFLPFIKTRLALNKGNPDLFKPHAVDKDC